VARLQLPSANQGRADAWSVSIGGGLAFPVQDNLALEAKVMRASYHGLDAAAGIGPVSWTGTLGLLINLP
jgi:hypothetical protein